MRYHKSISGYLFGLLTGFAIVSLSASAQSNGSSEWTWTSGSSTADCYLAGICEPTGVYGTLGIPAAGNVPGGREAAVSWTDNNGHLWLFGGEGVDPTLTLGYLNDLWEFNPSTSEWAWMSGSNLVYAPGVYGAVGVPDAGNTPGARLEATSWSDGSGNFWLFGGYGYDANSKWGTLNDLWKFSPSTGEWSWMGGSSALTCDAVNLCGVAGVPGTLGIPAPGNVPGGREGAVGWTDSTGNLWLFGGTANGSLKYPNDLWKFNPSTNEWTWMDGSGTVSQNGVYGTLGTPAAENLPGGRFAASGWTDGSGNLWLFGGEGIDAAGYEGNLNDLWRFRPDANQWTWMGGSSAPGVDSYGFRGQAGIYGTLAALAAENSPGGRQGAITWMDASGHLWLFGGEGLDSTGQIGFLNDLWEFDPSKSEWAWVGGSNTLPAPGHGQPGVYGTLGTPAVTNVPPGRAWAIAWTESSGDLWLTAGYGGQNQGAGRVFGNLLNDLWKYQLPSRYPGSPDFTVAASPASIAFKSGQSGTVAVSVTPANGFNSAVSFSCSGLPAGTSCTFSPATVTPSGTAASTTLTVAASSATASLHPSAGPLFPGCALAVALCCIGFRKRQPLRNLVILAVSLAGLGLSIGCGGTSPGSGAAPSSPQSSTSTVTVTATSGSLTHSATFSLTLN